MPAAAQTGAGLREAPREWWPSHSKNSLPGRLLSDPRLRGMLPEFPELRGYGRLLAKTVVHGGHREGMLRCGHLRGCFCTEWYYNFTPAVPAGQDQGKSRLSA